MLCYDSTFFNVVKTMERNFSRYMTNSQLSIKIIAHFYASLQIPKHRSSKHIRLWDYPTGIYLFKVNNGNRTMYETCLKLTKKHQNVVIHVVLASLLVTLNRFHIGNFEQISHIVLVFPLSTLNK